jgi:hypothetical protein
MFFMGEEIGAQNAYKYDNILHSREDILAERNGNGQKLFRFYQDLITLSRRLRSIRSHSIDILHQSSFNRVIVQAMERRRGGDSSRASTTPRSRTDMSSRRMRSPFPKRAGRRSSTAMHLWRGQRRQSLRHHLVFAPPAERGASRQWICGSGEAVRVIALDGLPSARALEASRKIYAVL